MSGVQRLDGNTYKGSSIFKPQLSSTPLKRKLELSPTSKELEERMSKIGHIALSPENLSKMAFSPNKDGVPTLKWRLARLLHHGEILNQRQNNFRASSSDIIKDYERIQKLCLGLRPDVSRQVYTSMLALLARGNREEQEKLHLQSVYTCKVAELKERLDNQRTSIQQLNKQLTETFKHETDWHRRALIAESQARTLKMQLSAYSTNKEENGGTDTANSLSLSSTTSTGGSSTTNYSRSPTGTPTESPLKDPMRSLTPQPSLSLPMFKWTSGTNSTDMILALFTDE